LKKIVILTAAVPAAVLFFLLATLPPAPAAHSLAGVDPALIGRTLAGAYHVHTNRSDGAASKDAVAAAAARARLQFVVLADHGDATRTADPPAYINGVLCIDAVEISTTGGHYVALDMPASPYPLGGAPSAVVEDVSRLGGFGVAAHPDHAKAELAWGDWDVPVDGLEWINADSEWRNESALQLTRVLFDYLFRPGPAIASVFDRPEKTLSRWDALSQTRRIVALAAVDAHGGGGAETDEGRRVVGPSYEASFRTLTNRVLLERAPTGDAAADARLLMSAIRKGAVYSVIDAISPDAVLGFDGGLPVLRSPLPDGGRSQTVSGHGIERIEVHAPRAPGNPPVPWVLSNWSGGSRMAPAESIPPASTTDALSIGEWRLEKDPESRGEVSVRDGAVTLAYQLASGPRRSLFVAAAADLAEAHDFAGIVFHGRASKPMRLSVQLRFPPDGARWVRSVYLAPGDREIRIPVSSMRAAERSSVPMPPPKSAGSLLLVVDLVNARPDDAGELTVSNLRALR
jgi:hypothetical protein